jgi:hypothetical protein
MVGVRAPLEETFEGRELSWLVDPYGLTRADVFVDEFLRDIPILSAKERDFLASTGGSRCARAAVDGDREVGGEAGGEGGREGEEKEEEE